MQKSGNFYLKAVKIRASGLEIEGLGPGAKRLRCRVYGLGLRVFAISVSTFMDDGLQLYTAWRKIEWKHAVLGCAESRTVISISVEKAADALHGPSSSRSKKRQDFVQP